MGIFVLLHRLQRPGRSNARLEQLRQQMEQGLRLLLPLDHGSHRKRQEQRHAVQLRLFHLPTKQRSQMGGLARRRGWPERNRGRVQAPYLFHKVGLA